MITLDEAKLFCRVDHNDDDAPIQRMILSAQDHLSSIGVDMTQDPMPEAINHAVLILVAHFFDNRETVDADNGVDRLIAPYRECLIS